MIFNLTAKFILKGEAKSSPFIFLFIVIIINISWSQLKSESWLHLNSISPISEDSSSYIHFYNDSHIDLTNFNDSLKFSKHNYSFKIFKKTTNGNINFFYNKFHSIIQLIEQDYLIKKSINFSEILLGYKTNRKFISTEISVSSFPKDKKYSPTLIIGANIHPNLSFNIGKKIIYNIFQFKLGYTDFLYSLNNISTSHIIDIHKINFNGEKYKIEYIMEYDKWEIDSSIYLIDLIYGENTRKIFNGHLTVDKNKKISLVYTNTNSTLKFKLLNDANNTFAKLNNYKNNINKFFFKYSSYNAKYKYNIIFQHRLLNLHSSIRIWPSRVNDNLNVLFNLVPIIINNSSGYLKQNIFSIKLMKIEKKPLNPYIQIDWIKDKYNVLFDTKSLSIFGFPIPDYSDNQKLNIIGKNAFNILIGTKIITNNWLFSASFSQHIPYKIYTIEELNLNQVKQKNDFYGGGKFNFTITNFFK